MNLDFSMVEMGDIVEYFKAILNVFLKIFNLEIKNDFTIGGIDIEIIPGTQEK
ncbi:MAG: hypothetical protein IIX36_03995 [Clostridia bacterium]|nr:hypothetical protein [Clostridia bacterium]